MSIHAQSGQAVQGKLTDTAKPSGRNSVKRDVALSNFAFLGSSVIDLHVAPGVVVELFDHGIKLQLQHPGEERDFFIGTDAKPIAGAKVNALQPIRSEALARYIDDVHPGGGALNQALALADIARQKRTSLRITSFDTSAPSTDISKACAESGIQLVSLARHQTPVNLVIQLQTENGRGADKLIVRGPLVRLSGADNHKHLPSPIDASTCLAIVSPKNGSGISRILENAPAEIYFQPTGSLDSAATFELTERASPIVTNFVELGKLAVSCGIPWSEISENDSDAPRLCKQTLLTMWKRGILGRGLAMTTLGRSGVVMVDFQRESASHHLLRLHDGCSAVATRNGAGDRWLAEFMHCHEVEQQPAPTASSNANIRVAIWLGLNPTEFAVETRTL